MSNVSKLLRSIGFSPLLLALSTFLLLFCGYFHEITAITQDLGRHLLTGKIILTTHSVPKTNLFSYTYPTFPFINSHWLSEVIFYLLQQSIGFSGLLLVMTILMLLTFALLWWMGRKIASPFVLATVSLFLFPILFERTDLRPEIFSFFLFALFLAILYTYRECFTKTIYLLPILSFLWVNTHIYFLIGILTAFLFLAEMLIRERKHMFTPRIYTLAGVFIACCLASLLNPNGLAGALYPFNVFHNYGYTIEENQNIFLLQSLFHKDTIYWFELGIVAVLLCMSISWRKMRLIDWFVVGMVSLLGMMAVRNFPLFVIGAFLPFSISLSAVTQRFNRLFTKSSQTKVRVLALCLLFLFCLWQLTGVLAKHPLGANVPSSSRGAVAYFLSHHLSGSIFNNFDIGSDLEYRLYPKEKTFVDGRPEAYPASFFQNTYIPMQQNPVLFQQAAKTYGFKTIIISHTDQTPWGEAFLANITKDPSWKVTYLDDTMVLLEPATSSSPTLSDDPESISPYSSRLQSLLQLAHFYSIVGWTKSLEADLSAILHLDPSNCPALTNMIILTQQANDPISQLYLSEYQTHCGGR